MIFALSRSILVTIIVFLSVGTIAVMAQIHGASSSAQIWTQRGLVLGIVNALILALCVPQIFGVIHRLSFARYWLFPLLDGVWDAEIRSNFPKIFKTYEAAKSRGPRFDAVNDMLSPQEAAAGVIQATVTIRSSLISLSIKVEPLGSTRISRSRFALPLWRKPDLPEISYVYEQIDTGPIGPLDSRRHFGAGVVTYDEDSGVIAGDYWTQRRDDLGFNTAGTIRMTRRRQT